MPRALKPLTSLFPWRGRTAHADRLYGAIVAQTRLPVFYQDLSVPDTLEGRFVVLSLHLFALLHRLKTEGPEGARLAQELADRFAGDMETVLREIGVGDLSVPKKVRGLTASGAALLQDFAEAFAQGDEAFAPVIAAALPLEKTRAEAASRVLAPYVKEMVRHLETEPLSALCAGALALPEVSKLRVADGEGDGSP